MQLLSLLEDVEAQQARMAHDRQQTNERTRKRHLIDLGRVPMATIISNERFG